MPRFADHPLVLRPTVLALLAAGCLSASLVHAQSLPAGTLPVRAANWLQKGQQPVYKVEGNAAQVNLKGPATVLNWNSMDVGKEARLTFNMVNNTDRVLNKVTGGAINNRTTIDGMFQSNGQVYIYNPNGIVFSKTATVDVNALVASSLKIDDQRFMDGILSPSVLPQLQADMSLGRLPGAVVVQGDKEGGVLQQAAITVAKNGFILLAAPTVSNAGKLSAPDGQVAMAAGTQVFLAAPPSSSTNMRGLLIEVGSQDLADLAAQKDFKPSVTNEALGQVDVLHGNATLVGRMVNQNGLISANTSVTLNGSIYLKAQDNATKDKFDVVAIAKEGGELSLGADSRNVITPDLQDEATVVKAYSFKPSEVQLTGQSIVLESGSVIRAAGGKVSLTAKKDPGSPARGVNDSRVVLKYGSEIDVSGSLDVPKAMESNVITAELRGGELADNLLLRDASLRGKTVRLDVRKAASVQLADVSGYVDQLGITVGEKTAVGGSLTLTSEGQVQLEKDSSINVSGGSLAYQAGHLNTTKLSLAGKLYDFETAKADLAYTGLVNLDNSSSNFEAGYRHGMNAGSVTVKAPNLSLNGTMQGHAFPGVNQRNLSVAVDAPNRAPDGATLTIEVPSISDVADTYRGKFLLNKVQGESGPDVKSLDVQGLAKDQGFRSFNLSLQGPVALEADLNLPATTQIKVSTPGDVQWAGSVSSAGGSVTLTGDKSNVNVTTGLKFDFAGTWVNDAAWVNAQEGGLVTALPAYAIDGGSLSLSGNRVSLGHVVVDVSGGAWMGTNGKVTAGTAGSISLTSKTEVNTLDSVLSLGEGTELKGYGLKAGGKLTLTGRNVWIGMDAEAKALPASDSKDAALLAAKDEAKRLKAAGDLVLAPEFLQKGGFASVTVTANGNLEVGSKAVLNMQPSNWQLPLDALQKASSAMSLVASDAKLDLAASSGLAVRPSSTLTLKASSRNLNQEAETLGRVRVGAGALLALDPSTGASKPSVLNLSATNGVTVGGRLQVPAGQVNVFLDNVLVPNVPLRQIRLSPGASIDVSGTDARLWVDGAGLATGEVLDGGSISINGNTGTVRLDVGSVLNVKGGKTEREVQFKSLGVLTDPQVVHSNAGTVDIRSSQGIWLGSTVQAQAGGTAQGGALSVTLDSPVAQAKGEPDRVVQLVNALPGMPVDVNGKAYVPVGNLSASGVTRLAVKSQNQIELGDGLDVAMASSLTLDAPQLVAAAGAQSASLAAPYVSIGNNDALYQDKAGLATDGTASLTVHARKLDSQGQISTQASTLDLQGQMSTQGFGLVNLQATGDIRLVGLSLGNVDAAGAAALTGRLDTGHALNLKSQQIYPSTLTQFELALNADVQPSRVSISAQPGSAGPVLSATGVVTVRADQIEQGGRLLAPQGQIRLLANESVVFTPSSVTSVAGNAATPVLLGRVTNGTDWTYTLANTKELRLTSSYAPNEALGEARLPNKTIAVQAPVVQLQAGAVLDLSGGGQIKSYDFLPGPGGSRDILQNAFAVLPGLNAPVAPLDVYEGTAGLRVGDQVYLSGVPGLNAGHYTLLPGHYALLPGGFAVQAQAGLRDMSDKSNVKNLDGSYTVSGYRSNSTDGRGDTRSSGFRVLPAEVVAKSSEFKHYSADDFFQAEAVRKGVVDPVLPADAGHLSIRVLAARGAPTASSLSLQGETRLGAAQGQRGTADVSAPNMEVVASANTNTGANVKVLVSELAALGAESILLGGQRKWASDGVHITVDTDRLRINNNSANALQGPEWLLAARNSLEITSQARLQATGTVTHAVQPMMLEAPDGNNAGAFVALSAAQGLSVLREDRTAGQQGILDLALGANIGSTGSMWLDATLAARLDANLNISRGATLGLSLPKISLGDSAPNVAGTAQLRGSNLLALNKVSSLSVQADERVDVYGDVNLGSGVLESLNLSAPLLKGQGGHLQVVADVITLGGLANGQVTTAQAAALNKGTLKLTAAQLKLGAGRLDVQGFGSVQLNAVGDDELKLPGDVVATALDNGVARNALAAQGALTVFASRLTTLDGASASLSSGQDLVLKGNGQAASGSVLGLGGSLVLEGRNVAVDTLVSAPSGSIDIQASEAATTGVTVESGRLEVQGIAKNFGSGHAYTPGGILALDGGAGNVTLGAQSVLDVSALGADAGQLQVKVLGSGASLVMKGTLRGQASGAADSGISREPQQGGFSLDVLSLKNAQALSDVNEPLNKAGFTGTRNVRVRQGDVTLSQGTSMKAHEISVTVDDGNLTVAGEMDARGRKGGRIDLYAGTTDASGSKGRITLESTAKLLAQATTVSTSAAGSEGDGGSVLLSVANANGQTLDAFDQGASLWLKAGSEINVSKGLNPDNTGLGQGGTIVLRAPRTSSGNDVAVGELNSTITGSRSAVVEAVKTYQAERISEAADLGTNLDAGSDGKMAREAKLFMAKASDINARLNLAGSPVRITPGVEVYSAGDLTVSVNEQADDVSARGWNLNAWRPGGVAGTLTLRAQSDLNILGSISDGFVKGAAAMPTWALDTSSQSWSMRLVGGKNVNIAFARQPLDTGTPVALVRTGTGQIDISAGRNVVLGSAVLKDPDNDVTSDQYFGAAIYTAGQAATLRDGFAAPLNDSNAQFGASLPSTKAAFGQSGGAIRIHAGQDVVGAPVPQLVNYWLFRQGLSTLSADGVTRIFDSSNKTPVISGTAKANAMVEVTVNSKTYTTTADALGNYKVQIPAGDELPDGTYTPTITITDAAGQSTTANSAAFDVKTFNTAWWARPDYFGTGVATLGGGDLSIRAGGSVKDVLASVATNAYLPAKPNGEVEPNRFVEQGGGDLSVRAGQNILGGQFYVQKGHATLRAGQSMAEGSTRLSAGENDDFTPIWVALNPVLALGDGSVDVTAGRSLTVEAAYNPTMAMQNTSNARSDAFSTYGQQSAVRFTSMGGQVVLANNGSLLSRTDILKKIVDSDNSKFLYALAPPNFKAVALGGDVTLKGGMSMIPSPSGQLELMAKGSVILPPVGTYNSVVMLDNNPNAMSVATAPKVMDDAELELLTGGAKKNTLINSSLIAHTPGQLHANDFQPVRVIALEGDVRVTETDAALPKFALVLPKQAEIIAGRDVRFMGFDIQHNRATDETVIMAGRDIVDPLDPDKQSPVKHTVTGPGVLYMVAGRDINLGNGQGLVSRGNMDNAYLPKGGAAIALLAGAARPEAELGLKPEEFEAKSAAFMGQPAKKNQDGVVEDATGLVGAAEKGLKEFDQAIAARFATNTLTGGDILVFGSQIKTMQGGAIDLMAPKGSVIAGLTTIPFYLESVSPSDNGIFTLRGGAIRVLVGQDFIVNKGRVFTLGGGDITMVSQYGNIDAGRGSKTASSAPPPLLTTDQYGNTALDVSGSISGSGIATLKTSDTQAPSNVVAIAPRGIFDAGDAGVRATGGVEIAAAQVQNANNISAAGGVTGAVMESGAPTAPASANASSAAPDVSRFSAATAAQNLTLSVDVMGYGSEAEADEDSDDDSDGKKKKKKSSGDKGNEPGAAATNKAPS